MEIKTNDYHIWFDSADSVVYCKGSFRLGGVEEYAPIVQLLNDAVAQHPATLTLDLRELEFLNSSGINILSKFVISVRQKGNISLVVLGSKKIPWQGKSLQNLQRLMPGLKLEIN
jgi:hypothetical protein